MTTVGDMLVFNNHRGFAACRGHLFSSLTFTNLISTASTRGGFVLLAPGLPSTFQVAFSRSLTRSQPQFPHP